MRAAKLFLRGALLFALLFGGTARAEDFEVRDVWLQRTETGYAVQADLALADSKKLRGILASGAPLRMSFEVRFVRERNWWPDEDLGFVAWEPSLSFDSLLSRYVVTSGERKTEYDSLSAALARLGRLRSKPSDNPGFARLSETPRIYVIARFEAEISHLSAPMQVDLLTDEEWESSSGWRRFPLRVRK